MGPFWEIILFAILIFYVFTLTIKWVFRRKMRKLEKKMEEFGQYMSQKESEEHKGPHIDPNIGEYTDFEEIEQKTS